MCSERLISTASTGTADAQCRWPEQQNVDWATRTFMCMGTAVALRGTGLQGVVEPRPPCQ